MLRKINFYSICFAFGLSVLLILAGSRYTDNNSYRPALDSRWNVRNFLKVEYMNSPQPLPTNVYDDPFDTERIMDYTRSRIETELQNYNFTYSGVNQLSDLVLEKGGNPKRSIIISTWRSGTTFLGEVLNAQSGNFYHYEPLLKYDIVQIRGPPTSYAAVSDLKNLIKCNFNPLNDYLEYGKTHLYQFNHNTRLWDHCKYRKELCFDAEFSSRFCKLFPFQSMKVVRLRLHLMEEFLQDKELNVKVLLLIRDPRAVMQSRQHRDFCRPEPDCSKAELLCNDMISDYVAAARLLADYPDRLMVLRYEELALNPKETIESIFKFLELRMTASVDEFIHSHTNVEVPGVSSTFRVSRNVPFRWTSELDYDHVDEIQLACKEAMDLWGYVLAKNAEHMASKEFNPLQPYTIKL